VNDCLSGIESFARFEHGQYAIILFADGHHALIHVHLNIHIFKGIRQKERLVTIKTIAQAGACLLLDSEESGQRCGDFQYIFFKL